MRSPFFRHVQGSTIVAVLIVVIVASVLVGVAVRFSSQNNRLAARQREVMSSVAAADGALEYAYAVWKDVVRGGGMRAPTTAQLSADQRVQDIQSNDNSAKSPTQELAPTRNALSSFTIASTDPWGTVAPDPTVATSFSVAVDGYPGWKGNAFFYKATVKATGPKTVGMPDSPTATVSRYFSLTNVPLFQAAIFYMDNLEIHPGALMTIRGLVHTNANLYAAGYAKLQFMGNVSYAGSFNESAPTVGDWTGSGSGDLPTITPYWRDGKQSIDSTEKSKQLSPVDRIEPFGKKPQELFSTTDSNLNNDGFHEWIEPPVTSQPDPPEIADQRLYNKAGLRIKVDSSKALTSTDRIKVTDGFGNALTSTQDAAVKAAIDGGVTIYDWREGNGEPGVPSGNVKVTSVDVKKLNTALSGMSGFNGVVYVYDVATGKNAIRLKNGASLTADLTVASANPVYIQGDYNTGWGGTGTTHDPNGVPSNENGNLNGLESPVVPGYTKKSAAVIADAVVVLSNNWNDANSTKSLSNRIATHTTVNAAFMAGDVPTNYKNNGIASGGAHNFPRFLEQWYNSGTSQYVDFTYYGSMVQAFTSQTFTGAWRTGNVYVWPNRKWTFEDRFTTNPPPGTVGATKFARGRWERL
jgi:type II secretory pathway pseudopilin PulG